jgi:redox-sensing transcriptional repressor
VELAEASGVNPAQVRKDLTHLRSSGKRGVGYDVRGLAAEIRRELGFDQRWPVVIVGAGHLGQALATYPGFLERGFEVTAVLDADPAKTGTDLGGLKVEPLSELRRVTIERDVAIGVVCTPAEAAQETAERLVAAGVRSILNFAPVPLTLPGAVNVRQVDLSVELQILAFHEQRRTDGEVPGP